MATIKLTGFNTSTGRSTTAGDNDTVDLDGSLTIGNADSDAVIFNAEIDSDFIPDDTATYDLGSASKAWNVAYVSGLSVSGDASDEFIAIIDNDQSSNAHGLKITSDGTGTGTRIFDVESVSTTIMRIRGDGRIGMGKVTSLPDARLTVEGSGSDADLAVGSKIQHIGDSDTFLGFADDEIALYAGNVEFLTLQEATDDFFIINNGSATINMQVKGSSDANLLVTDAANDRVGVGTGNPIAKIDIAGKIAITSESATPSQPSDGQGYLYTKTDGKLYWRSFDLGETDLTASGGGGGSPGGNNDEIQFNSSGSFGGSTNLTFASNEFTSIGNIRQGDANFGSAAERVRSFTYKRHFQFTGISANTWTDVISFRPYLTGTTTDPSADSFYSTVAFKMEIFGNTGNVGSGYRSRMGSVQFGGSSASAASATDTTLDSPISTRVDRSGWVTTLQINPDQAGATNFTGVVYLEIYFSRGQGSNGNNIEWSLA